LFVAPVSLHAQIEDYVPEAKEVVASVKEPGWFPRLAFSGTAALSSTSKVVGTDDGSTWNLGSVINAGLDWRHLKGHVVENALSWQLTYTRVSVLDRFYKSMDSFDWTSTYMYEIPGIPWMGPYGRLRIMTSVFEGYTVKPEDTTVTRLEADGTVIGAPTVVKGRRNIPLTDAFAPTTIRESAGLFARPYENPWFAPIIRLGAGAWQVVTRGGFTIKADDATAGLTVQRMTDSNQAGGEAELAITGKLAENTGYKLGTGVMYPFWSNLPQTPTGTDALNSEFALGINVKLADWAGLDYSFKAVRYPLIVDEWQISNSLLLSITAAIL
jgi:hypothetical protein